MEKPKKLHSYLGFAAKSRNIVTGYNTCIFQMNKRKIKLLILANDISPNTMDKMMSEIRKHGCDYRIYGTIEELSRLTGNEYKGIYGIVDQNFADMIRNEIDKERSDREVF